MRFIGRLFLVLIGSLLVLFIALKLYQNWLNSGSVQPNNNYPNYDVLRVIELSNNKTVNYSLPATATDFKLIIYPLFSYDQKQKAAESDFEVIVHFDNKPAKNFRYIPKIKDYINIQNDQSVEPYLYKPETRVTSSHLLKFELDEQSSKNFHIEFKGEFFKNFLVRSYFQQSMSKKRVIQQWDRASNSQKKALTKYHPLDKPNISNDEIDHLYSNLWSYIAPVGNDGQDFLITNLYEYENRHLLIENFTYKFADDYFWLPKQHKITFKVKKEAIKVKFSFKPLTPQTNYSLKLLRKNNNLVETQELSMSADTQLRLERGSYELSLSSDMGIKISSEDQSALDWSNLKQQAYILNTDDSLVYPLAQYADVQQRYRLSHRQLQTNISSDSIFKLEYLDVNGYKISSLRYQFKLNDDEYSSYLKGDNQQLIKVSEQKEIFLQAPAEAYSIKIISLTNANLFNLDNTIKGLASIKYIGSEGLEYQDSWFKLKPLNHIELARNKKISSYAISNKHIIESLEAPLVFEAIKPIKGQRSKYLYLNSELSEAYDFNALAFMQMDTNKKNTVHYKNSKNLSQLNITPSLLLINEHNKPLTIELTIDQHKQTLQINNPLEEIELGKLTKGDHFLTIKSNEDLKVFSNYTKTKGLKLRRKKVYKALSQMEFPFYKSNQLREMISINGLTTQSKDNKLTLTLYKNGEILENGLTQSNKQVQWVVDDELSKNILSTSQCTGCKMYQTQFFALQQDLSPGWYQLRVKIDDYEDVHIELMRSFNTKPNKIEGFSDEN